MCGDMYEHTPLEILSAHMWCESAQERAEQRFGGLVTCNARVGLWPFTFCKARTAIPSRTVAQVLNDPVEVWARCCINRRWAPDSAPDSARVLR